MAGKSTKEMFGDVFGHNILILILISYICIYIYSYIYWIAFSFIDLYTEIIYGYGKIIELNSRIFQRCLIARVKKGLSTGLLWYQVPISVVDSSVRGLTMVNRWFGRWFYSGIS